MGGRILAINEGFGYRPVLSVQTVNVYPQNNATRPSTVLCGIQLLLPYSPMGGIAMAANEVTFPDFLSNLIGQPTLWNQLRAKPNESYEQFVRQFPQLPFFSIAEATCKLVASGSDPLRGFWVQFDGSIAPLFSQPRWWDDTTDDDMLLFQGTLPGQGSGCLE